MNNEVRECLNLLQTKKDLNDQYNFWFRIDTAEATEEINKISKKLQEINDALSKFDDSIKKEAESKLDKEELSKNPDSLSLPKINGIVSEGRSQISPLVEVEDMKPSPSWKIEARDFNPASTCLRVNEQNTKMVDTSKTNVDYLKTIFSRARSNLKERFQDSLISKEEFKEYLEEAKREVKEEVKGIVRVRRLEGQNNGYIMMGSLLVVATLALGIIIFTIIGNILR